MRLRLQLRERIAFRNPKSDERSGREQNDRYDARSPPRLRGRPISPLRLLFDQSTISLSDALHDKT
jgi:hypothetical protein